MHNHKHGHNHHHCHTTDNLNSLKKVLIITTIYMFLELIGGYFTNSLALMADAGHMFGDVFSLSLAFFAIRLTVKKAPPEKTFGYYRAEILAAFLNGLTLVIISALIFYEAYQRLIQVQNVQGLTMLLIALGGLIINIIGAKILHSGSEHNINVKGAFLHVLADLLGSIGAITAGLLIYFFNLNIADPIISFIIALLVLFSSFGIIKQTTDVLMESAPSSIDIDEVKKHLENIDGIKDVHDLHIWCININKISLSVHIVTDIEKSSEILYKAKEILKEHFDIEHSTIQIEPENFCSENCIFQNED